MVKKIISVVTAFLMLCCTIPFAAFADDVLDICPECGERTYETWTDFSTEVPDLGFPISVKRRICRSCGYAYYDWNCLGFAGFKEFDNSSGSFFIDYIKDWKNKTFGKNTTATKFTPGGGSTSGGGVGRPKGYADDNGTANYNSSGVLQVVVNPIGFHWDSSSYKGSKFGLSLPVSVDVSGSQFGLTSNPKWALYAIYEFVAPCDGIFYLGREACGQTVFTSSLFYNSSWYTQNYNIPNYDGYGLSVSASKGQTLYYVSDASVCSIDGCQRTGAIKAEAYPLIILCEPLSSLTKLTNITINNNTWNGNIYTDNSTNLTYIYPQYTTINEKNETVTNISNTPIIYNNETKQYYTYDQTTKNYYYITYNENPTTPTPSPSPTPDPDNPSVTPTPTPTPGGDTGDTTGILAVLVEIRDNMIQGFLDIKAAFVAGFAELSANFTLAIENLTLNIQNFFFKGMSGSPVDPNIPGGGSISTPETGGSDSSSGSGWSWNPLKWLTDLLKDIVEGIIKTIWKLITSLFGFLLWLLSLVGKLFPFIPGQAVLAVTSAVVIVAVIRIIKFITGR